jgi:saccharopine dehydrogenase-like NADP-dependent oxidoreductase
MKRILIIGAGLSSPVLINYLLGIAEENAWEVRVGDISIEAARDRINNHPAGEAVYLNAEDLEQTENEIKNAEIIISLLPSGMHTKLAQLCVKHSKNLITASHLNPEIKKLHAEAVEKGILIMNEAGVDPGLDHMSAMRIINKIKEDGDKVIACECYTGGLVAPGYDNNPWRYKFTWNPGSVVLAGSGGARFYHHGKFKYIPYHKIFCRSEIIDIPGLGEFEMYPNGDSLSYKGEYGLTDPLNMFRGTIRRPGFCEAWNLLVQLGATDNSYIMENTEKMTYREFTNSFLAYDLIDQVETKAARYLKIEEDSELMAKLKWLGLFDRTVIGIPGLTPAKVLQHILDKKWKLAHEDRDMILMQHQIDYIRLGTHRRTISNMVIQGENSNITAIAISVGLPLALITEFILKGKIKLTGVHIPTHPVVYEPVLEELMKHGITFSEKDVRVS